MKASARLIVKGCLCLDHHIPSAQQPRAATAASSGSLVLNGLPDLTIRRRRKVDLGEIPFKEMW